MTARVVVASPTDPTVGVLVTSLLDQEASRTLDRSGSVVHEWPAARALQIDALVRWRGSTWKVLSVDAKTREERS